MPDTVGAARYAEKMKRIMDAVELRQPDRVPVAFYTTFWLSRYGGISYRDIMYDPVRSYEILQQALIEFDPDMYFPPYNYGPLLDAVGYKQLQWPGHGVGDNHPFQYLDREYMSADEYDDFLFDPTGFYLNKYLPRVAEAFEGFAEMPLLPGLAYLGVARASVQFGRPGLRQAFEAVQKTADEALRLSQRDGAFKTKMAALGFPDMFGAISHAPFDYFGDYMRGAKGILTDIRRRPEKLLEAMDKAGVFILRQALRQASISGNKFVFIPIHWGPDGFMSPVQFKTIWWPSFKTLLLGLIENGLIPVVLWEADCTSRLEVIGDMPCGKAVYWFERTDIYRAKEVLGDTVCIRGNVSPSLMTTGSPEEVDANCRQLIEKVGRGGGFILDTAFGIPDEAPVENVRAMYKSVRKYSV